MTQVGTSNLALQAIGRSTTGASGRDQWEKTISSFKLLAAQQLGGTSKRGNWKRTIENSATARGKLGRASLSSELLAARPLGKASDRGKKAGQVGTSNLELQEQFYRNRERLHKLKFSRIYQQFA